MQAQHNRVAQIWEEIEECLSYAARLSGAGPTWSVEKACMAGTSMSSTPPNHNEEALTSNINESAGCISGQTAMSSVPSSSTDSFRNEDTENLVSVFEAVASEPPKKISQRQGQRDTCAQMSPYNYYLKEWLQSV